MTLKAYAMVSRQKAKDCTDIHNLLSIAQAYEHDKIGGWKLSSVGLQASRLDTARILHRIADGARSNRSLQKAGVPQDRLVALIRRLITDPR